MKKEVRATVTMSSVIETSENRINDPKFLDFARNRPQDFTRSRKMPFNQLVLFMLNLVKSSIQTCLDLFF